MNINENKLITNKTDHISDPIDKALFKFEHHPSILKIKEKVGVGVGFSFNNVSKEEIMKEIKKLNPKKATTSESIPTGTLKKDADIIGEKIGHSYELH